MSYPKNIDYILVYLALNWIFYQTGLNYKVTRRLTWKKNYIIYFAVYYYISLLSEM